MKDENQDVFFEEERQDTTSAKQLISMLDSYDKKQDVDISIGAKVSGRIVRIADDFVFVDIGAKNEAAIKKAELLDQDGLMTSKEGDIVTAHVVSATNNEIVLSKAMSGFKVPLQQIIELMKNRTPVLGKITGINKGGFNVKIMGHLAFCPISQISLEYVENTNEFLSKTLPFIINEIRDNGRTIVVSRIPILEAELEKAFERFEQQRLSKTIVKGRITRIAPFGLFVDLGGYEGLVHISEVSWSRSENLTDSFTVGQCVECIIIGIERKESLRTSKIALSIKQAIDDPWSSLGKKLSVGQVVEGTITRIVPFGAFVELLPGVEGLIHVSEMSWTKRIHHPSEVVALGQRVKTTILSIDEIKKNIKCSLKDVAEDPWASAVEKFKVGATVNGTIVQKSRYGYFVDLAEGITGLMVFANIAEEKKESLKVGDTIEVTIESLDTDKRRISLSFGKTKQRQNESELLEYMSRQQSTTAQPVSEFGAALKAAIEKKSS